MTEEVLTSFAVSDAYHYSRGSGIIIEVRK